MQTEKQLREHKALKALAVELGGAWDRRTEWCGTAGTLWVGADWEIWVTQREHEDKAELSLQAPKAKNGQRAQVSRRAPRINASLDRETGALARDITRRLLNSEAAVWLAECWERNDSTDAYNAKRARTRRTLERAGVTFRDAETDIGHHKGMYGVRVSGSDVRLELYVTAKRAAAILRQVTRDAEKEAK